MAANIKNKQIQVQKPAQSLKAFQDKIASGADLQTGILKPVLITAGAVVLVALLGFGFSAWRTHKLEKHEAELSQLLLEVKGDGRTPVQPAELEKLMRERLPRLEALAAHAPSSRRAITAGILNAWRVELDGKAAEPAVSSDPWVKLCLAQRQIALGQAPEAIATLTPMRKSASSDEPWAGLYWKTLLDARRLQGDRDAAWKDLAEYKSRFHEDEDIASMERMVAGI